MKMFIALFFAAVCLKPFASMADEKKPLRKTDFTSWAGAQSTDFGCFLEKEFGHKDKKFNCGLKKYVNNGDPCKNTKEYYEGPKFPKVLAEKVDSRIDSIDLAWEHGDLQNVSVTMKKKYSEKELQAAFKLPENASIQDCSKTNTCILIDGFDHMGAGDVDCGG